MHSVHWQTSPDFILIFGNLWKAFQLKTEINKPLLVCKDSLSCLCLNALPVLFCKAQFCFQSWFHTWAYLISFQLFTCSVQLSALLPPEAGFNPRVEMAFFKKFFKNIVHNRDPKDDTVNVSASISSFDSELKESPNPLQFWILCLKRLWRWRTNQSPNITEPSLRIPTSVPAVMLRSFRAPLTVKVCLK